jgi:hypothetical protein
VIIPDIKKYVRKFILIVRKSKKGLVSIIPILKTISVDIRYIGILGITMPLNTVVVKKKINKRSKRFLK